MARMHEKTGNDAPGVLRDENGVFLTHHDYDPDISRVRRGERGFFIGEVAEMFGVQKTTIRKWMRRGWLRPSLRSPGGHAIFTESDISRAMELGRERYREALKRWAKFRRPEQSGGFPAKRPETKTPNCSASDSAAR